MISENRLYNPLICYVDPLCEQFYLPYIDYELIAIRNANLSYCPIMTPNYLGIRYSLRLNIPAKYLFK